MKRIFKVICPLLALAILFSSCTFNASEKALEQINIYLENNEFNSCHQYVKELEDDEKSSINDEVCNSVISKFVALREKTNIDEASIYDLSLIDTAFAENCQKLWNIISEFSIDKAADYYKECINLRYYSEMIDYTRYCEIYSLLKKADNSGYLDELSVALYEYETNGNNANLKLLFDEINSIDYSSFNPQQYLVTDFRDAHEDIVDAINDLDDGFDANDSTTVATAVNTLHNALTDILYITDTLSAVNSMQKSIYSKISTENIYAPFNSEIYITKRDYTSGMSFTLDSIFGVRENTETDKTTESTTIADNSKISKSDAIKIAVNAINKTKSFKGTVNITLTQTRNIQLSAFESYTTITDAENMTKAQLNQIIKQSNGTGEKTVQFSNGINGTQTLNDFIPPSSKTASVDSDSVTDYSCVQGSGGYVITLVLKSELVETGKESTGIGTLVNTFEFDNSDDVKNFDTSYSETTVSVIVNNSGRLIEMEYTIDGISNCDFEENDGANEYKAQFTFKNHYKYEFKY